MTITTEIGLHEKADPSATAERYPGARVGREFIDAKSLPAPRDVRPDFDQLAAPWLALTDGVVYVSLKPKVADVATGAWSAPLRQLGTWLAAHGDRVRVILHHEPEDDMSGQAFAAMFNRGRETIKATHPGAVVAYCAMSYQSRPGGRAAVSPAGWQSVVADEYLCDVYSGESFPDSASLGEHPGFLGWYDTIVRPKLIMSPGRIRWGLGERGYQSTDPATRVATIDRDGAYLCRLLDGERAGTLPPGSAASVVIGWNTAGTEADAGWLFDDPARDAFARMVGLLTYVPEPPDPFDVFTNVGSIGPASSKTTLFRHDPTGVIVADRAAWLAASSAI